MSRHVIRFLAAGCLSCTLAVLPVFAHHGVSVKFDPDREMMLAGRVVKLDWANPHDGGFEVEDGNFLYFGRAVGEWEGDTFVVVTEGFNERFWFSNGGLPHTQQLRLTERFSRPDFDTLNYEVTIDDPGAYTRPWSASWTMRWVPDQELPQYYCQDNRP